MAEILAATSGNDATFNRGKIVNDYSGRDNNGNLRKQTVYIPNNDQNTSPTSWYQQYEYDSLNRLTQVHEHASNPALDWQQSYSYDRYGNRTIDTDPTHTWGSVNNLGFQTELATNRLYSPGDLTLPDPSRRMQYDAAGRYCQLKENLADPTAVCWGLRLSEYHKWWPFSSIFT